VIKVFEGAMFIQQSNAFSTGFFAEAYISVALVGGEAP
jgi:hypothetical protein